MSEKLVTGKFKWEQTTEIMFDESNFNWDVSNAYNMIFIESKINMFNGMLRYGDHVLLTEVYKELGIMVNQSIIGHGWTKKDECINVKIDNIEEENRIKLTFKSRWIVPELPLPMNFKP